MEFLKSLDPDFRSPIYDFGRRPENSEILTKLTNYDASLFLLWNLMHNRWELWRWKVGVEPREPTSERQVYRLARVQDANVPADMRLIEALPRCDLWAAAESDDEEAVADHIEDKCRQGNRRKRQEARDTVRDFVQDNRRVLKEGVGEMFRGFYPSNVNPPFKPKKQTLDDEVDD